MDFITRARHFRKVFGGGMRQAGILAAAGVYALDHNIARLAEDHANARHFAEILSRHPHIELDPASVETNIVVFSIRKTGAGAAALCQKLHSAGVRVLPRTPDTIRAVFSLMVSSREAEEAAALIGKTL
jgi:threonine aldolase